MIILVMDAANERRRYIVTSSLIGCTHTQNELWDIQDYKVIRIRRAS